MTPQPKSCLCPRTRSCLGPTPSTVTPSTPRGPSSPTAGTSALLRCWSTASTWGMTRPWCDWPRSCMRLTAPTRVAPIPWGPACARSARAAGRKGRRPAAPGARTLRRRRPLPLAPAPDGHLAALAAPLGILIAGFVTDRLPNRSISASRQCRRYDSELAVAAHWFPGSRAHSRGGAAKEDPGLQERINRCGASPRTATSTP